MSVDLLARPAARNAFAQFRRFAGGTAGAILLVVLAVHAGWILFHLSMVARDRVDPWKLGGYGMYTVPSPEPRLAVYDIGDLAAPREIERRDYRRDPLVQGNPNRSFRCMHHGEDRLKAFFAANPSLKGRNIGLVWTDRFFTRDPVGTQRRMQGHVEMIWRDATTFDYTSTFCGESTTGTVSMAS